MSENIYTDYTRLLAGVLSKKLSPNVYVLGEKLLDSLENDKHVFLCGNGGSAANANHLANDFISIGFKSGKGIMAEALTANSAVLTCIANDYGYEDIFSRQLEVKATEGDVLIALSGSGNSVNIVSALNKAASIGMETFSIVGFDGGESKLIANHPIHFDVHDMQIAEDLQLVVGHMCMRWMLEHRCDGGYV